MKIELDASKASNVMLSREVTTLKEGHSSQRLEHKASQDDLEKQVKKLEKDLKWTRLEIGRQTRKLKQKNMETNQTDEVVQQIRAEVEETKGKLTSFLGFWSELGFCQISTSTAYSDRIWSSNPQWKR